MTHLRYLALGQHERYREFEIPPCISKLENLQTIVFRPSKSLLVIGINATSFEIWKMPNLRHVIVHELKLPSPNLLAHVLQNLRTLSRVVNFRFTKRDIQMIPNLQKLKVQYESNEPYEIWERFSETNEPYGIWEKFCLYNLALLHHLEALDICFNFGFKELNPGFPENFAFPQKLKKLTLDGCQILWKDMTVVGSLPHLEVLKLKDNAFVGDEWEPVEREFPQLKFLLMETLNLKYWRAEDTHFPRLKHLQISSCDELEEIPPGIGEISTLEFIEVFNSISAAYSVLQIQEEQRDLGNDALQVHVYHFDDQDTW